MIHDTHSTQIQQKQNEHNIYVIMKIMCPPGYHLTDFVEAHAIGHMKYAGTNEPRTTKQARQGA